MKRCLGSTHQMWAKASASESGTPEGWEGVAEHHLFHEFPEEGLSERTKHSCRLATRKACGIQIQMLRRLHRPLSPDSSC